MDYHILYWELVPLDYVKFVVEVVVEEEVVMEVEVVQKLEVQVGVEIVVGVNVQGKGLQI